MSDQQLLSAVRGVNPVPDPDRLLIDEAEERAFFAAVQGVRMVHLAHPVESRPRRRWLVAVGAAVAVLVLVGGVAWLFRVTASDLPVATTPQIDPLSSLTWSRVPHDEAVFGGPIKQSMFDVTAGGPGLVAVGGEEWPDIGTPSAPAPPNGAVWTSADGITWSRVPHNEAVFGRASISSVTAGGHGLVAVGSTSVVPGVGRNAVVWTSADGITWSRVPHNEAVFGNAAMFSVTAGGRGLVAVGFDGPPQTARGNAAVWTSPDGVTWSRVPQIERAFGESTGEWMSSVTVGGPGFVAIGSQWVARDEVLSDVMWTSVDSITWSRVPDDEAVFGKAGISSVTVGGPGLVAVGEVGPDAAVWTSVDGITWSRVPHDEAIFGGESNYWISSVTAAGSGLVAVGGSSLGQGDGQGAVWTSPDGITWSRVPHNEAIFGGQPDGGMSSVTLGGPGLVAVGESGSEEDFDAAVWNATAQD